MNRYIFLAELISILEARGWDSRKIAEAIADILCALQEEPQDDR